ncbi:MAG TPA: FAD-dependent oxidoreductase, partial [Candidatus Limnocylindria bacterium]|nr:FAD-dependent oxidoreductase [Candidatus Limnocylindria bacterium]
MDSITADLLVIGFGKGGKTLAATMGRRGSRVVMVEQSPDMYGGTCINVACVPTKALIHDAARRPAGSEPEAWYGRSVDRKDAITGAMRSANFSMLDTLDTVTVVTGRASFVGPRAVSVIAGSDELRIDADTIVINTGSLPRTPSIPGAHESHRVHTSTSMLERRSLPRRLAIVGGGYIGLEFASMYRGFGSEVTILESGPAILRREDDDVAEAVRQVLDDSGIRIVTGASATGISEAADEVTVSYSRGGTEESLTADAILLAVGRAPDTHGLALDAAGVELDARGAVVVDEYLRTTAEGVFAVGDVNGGPQFTYISLDDYRIVLDRL